MPEFQNCNIFHYLCESAVSTVSKFLTWLDCCALIGLPAAVANLKYIIVISESPVSVPSRDMVEKTEKGQECHQITLLGTTAGKVSEYD